MKTFWKTKENEIIKISAMRTGHIRNCIKFLDRMHNLLLTSLYEASMSIHSVLASEILEKSIEAYEERGCPDRDKEDPSCDVCQYLNAFEKELARRKEPLTL